MYEFVEANDKLFHLLVSYFLAAGIYYYLRIYFRSRLMSYFIAVSLAILVGVVKEMTDYHFDMADLNADMFGAVCFPVLFIGAML